MILDTREYVTMLRELTDAGHEVRLRIAGNSMLPFLRDGRDSVFFRRPDSPLRPGDIVFYQRPTGQYVLHRICRIRGGKLFFAGDAQNVLEGPAEPSEVFARVTRVCRKDRILTPDSICWKFYSRVWRHLRPVRGPLLWIYRGFARLRRAFMPSRQKNTEDQKSRP